MLKRPGFDYKTAEIRDFIHSFSDKTVINSRLAEHGDYETPEQFIPVYPPKGPWELCVTTNNTWSYTGKEEQYKTPYEIITMFTECLGMGGNMLLNVGPDESGIIPQQQVALLETLGKWISKHEEAVYGTVRGLPHGYAYGFTSLNKARDVIYLYLSHIPKEMTLIKGIHNNVKKATILGKGTPCATKRIGGAPWMNVPGSLGIDVPKGDLDEYVTVLKIELDGPLNLYSGEGVEINVN
jgi:alpha-L-fucosidase